MSAPAAIRATFVDLKTVKTRRALQLVFEVPLEQMEQAIDCLGVPMPDKETWCGIARLVAEPEKAAEGRSEKRRWDDLPPGVQAGIACADPVFRAFLFEKKGLRATDEEDAACTVRSWCNVESRGDIERFPASLAAWRKLHGEFQAWKAAER